MVFVDSIADLEYYFPNPQWGCYGDTVFEAHDILLQANGFEISGGYTAQISVCDPSGVFIDDATANFDTFLASFVIAGTTYYYVNVRCDSFTSYMMSARCFILRVSITDTTTTEVVFDKYTQRYNLAPGATTFIPAVIMDGESLPNCVPGETSEGNCNRNFVKFKSTFDCIDTFTGDYYGEGNVISGTNNYPFTFERFSYIEGKIRRVPRAIKRTISINCRTQKTESTPLYLLTGNVTFPVWKVEEIEQMMLASHLYVDDVEYQSEGGTIFEQFGPTYNCQYRYKLTINLQKCFEWQIFGCVPSCESLSTYYLFPRTFERLYDDSQQIIATDNDELTIYFKSQPGYKSVALLPFNLPCPTYAIFNVQSSGVLPKFIYVDEITPASRIFPKQLPVNSTNLMPLCNGVTFNNQVPEAEVTGNESELIEVPLAEVTGYESMDANSYILQVDAADGFTINPNYSSAANYEGEVSLNISVSSTVISDPLIAVPIAQINGNGIPATTKVIYGNDNPNLPPDSVLTINIDGSIVYTGNATSTSPGTIYVEFFMVKYYIN